MKHIGALLVMLLFAVPVMADAVTDNVSFAWTSCEDTKKCVSVHYDCDSAIAVNALHVNEVKQLIAEKGLTRHPPGCVGKVLPPTRATCVEDTCTLITK